MDIMGMSAMEIRLIDVFVGLAKEAFEAEALIKKHFNSAFGIDRKVIHVYHRESCGEYCGDGYLSIDGVFRYYDNWWKGREYEFNVDADGIYKMLRSSYLRRNKMASMDSERFDCDIEHIDDYFRDFIKTLAAKGSE